MSDEAEILTRFSRERLQKFRLSDELVRTTTTESQSVVEENIWTLFNRFFTTVTWDSSAPRLQRQQHWDFLESSIFYLPASYECLDASRPWLCYWILHSLALLGHHVSHDLGQRVTEFLARCQSASGGFGGGPGQLPHLASTYAAVNALCTIGSPAALNIINRPALVSFLSAMKRDDGAFYMHHGGEVDIRGVYCAVSVAKLTNTYSQALFRNTAKWLVSCQTYEGGFSGFPGLEAHGGYTFCGLASLMLLGEEDLCDVSALMRWISCRQMAFEGGFSGRTGKLVDSCYSFWQGANFPLVQHVLSRRGMDRQIWGGRLFDELALQFYVLVCCQHARGGFVDKPGKHRDFYHTCYALSGLSLAQNYSKDISPEQCNTQQSSSKQCNTEHSCSEHRNTEQSSSEHRNTEQSSSEQCTSDLLGPESNRLELVDPLFNLRVDHLKKATSHFSSLPSCHLAER